MLKGVEAIAIVIFATFVINISEAIVPVEECIFSQPFNLYFEGSNVIGPNNMILKEGNDTFPAGETVILIIQMQGGNMITSDDASYGGRDFQTPPTVPGVYEFNIVTNVNINSPNIEITTQYTILNSFVADTRYRFQVITVPLCYFATINSITSWDSWNGKTGGIVSLLSMHLNITGDIDISGIGYRGGPDILWTNNNPRPYIESYVDLSADDPTVALTLSVVFKQCKTF